jgi:hypothetical protein
MDRTLLEYSPELEIFETDEFEAGELFGGDPALQQWAIALVTTWAKRVKTKPDEQQRVAKETKNWLDRDMKVMLAAAYKRKGVKQYGMPAIIRAWQISREQQMDFITLDKTKKLVNFQPPPPNSVLLVKAKDFVEDSDKYPVAPLIVTFMQKLLQIYPQVRADTYANHGGGAFRGRGFSIDLWLDHSPKDARGFWRHKDAVDLLRAVRQAARAADAEWRVLYNDYLVASVINQETGARRVGFAGGAFPGGGLNWHGPHPLILHFHLDLTPLSGAAAATSSPRPPASPKPAISKPSASISTVATADLPHGPLGTLIAQLPRGLRFSYRFTPEDLLWTARFLMGEAGGKNNLDNHAVIWAMFNRYALFTHKYFPTFHQFIRAYSTPLQPVLKSWGAARRHMHKKTFVRTGGTYAPGHPEVPKGQLRQHLNLQKTPWGSLPQGARIVAEAAIKGHLRNPIGLASEFGSTYVYFHDQYGRYPRDEEWRRYTEAYARGKKWVWVGSIPGLNQKENAMFIQAAVAKLPPGTVRVV